eukprot:TRINITY_DN53641_c0_g1_i1.p1 TRINITY_DN53641_c0_g1~~TRINITY_DN53641_c0_g1_i1.p1  ORF type:complete len:177 (-),score=28.34 TRINITY_DN53641_c0_g1_i1:239-769(-)
MARQREGTRLQQQCGDARQEVLELSAQVLSSGPTVSTPKRQGLGRSFSATALDSTVLRASLQDAQFLDAEMLDLKHRCKDLEQDCARMHAVLERGQTACEKWRRRGIGMPIGTLEAEPFPGSRPKPFELGPAEALSAPRTPASGYGRAVSLPRTPVSEPRTPEARRNRATAAPVPP